MEKIKFGIQIMVLLLAFPVWFVAEISQADKAVKQDMHKNKIEQIDVKKPVAHEAQKQVAANLRSEAMQFSNLVFSNN